LRSPKFHSARVGQAVFCLALIAVAGCAAPPAAEPPPLMPTVAAPPQRFPVVKDQPRRYVEIDLGPQRGKVVRLLLGSFHEQTDVTHFCHSLRDAGLYCAPHSIPEQSVAETNS
jgi:hypothetical protein